ncbi:MAG: hypothetical protein C5B56_11525 [Proteobacteria bacterium]|nr:MAG: hypothetical protein C5B56_11525 [Pseudomonadota bacterium]
MRNPTTRNWYGFALSLLLVMAPGARAQSATGSLDFVARVTPTAARPEPVRQFTFYVLTKSYGEIAKEVAAQDVVPSREQFIDDLKVSAELKAWLKSHEMMDLTMPGLDKLLTADDIVHVPEFLLAYQRSNSGGVTRGIPLPRYADADKTANPARYEKQMQEYLTALKKFIAVHPETVSGMEMELDAVNPQRRWAKIQGDHRRRVQQLAPDMAQTKYLVAKADTDLDGRATVYGLPAGSYWISSLNLDANAGDIRLRWDVPIKVQAGQTARVELTNLNATDAHTPATP